MDCQALNQKVVTLGNTNYDKLWAEVYGDMQDIGPVHRHMRRIIAKLLSGINYSSLLDVGCGTGHNFSMLCERQKVNTLTGVDISQEALDQAKKKYKGEFFKIDIEKERLEGKWELVYCSLLLEHLQDDLTALRYMYAMCDKYLLVTTISGDFEKYKKWDAQMGHVRNYQRGELEKKIIDSGFNIERVIYWGYPFYSPLTRIMQNKMKAANKIGLFSRITAYVTYYLYFLNLICCGDLLIILARKQKR